MTIIMSTFLRMVYLCRKFVMSAIIPIKDSDKGFYITLVHLLCHYYIIKRNKIERLMGLREFLKSTLIILCFIYC